VSALAGLRVLDLTRLLPGPFCSLLLADFGADVIKVEDLGGGDYARADPPAFAALNRGKRSIRLDLKSGGGRDAFVRLARDADVVLESFRPGVLDRLGVGWERLHAENPRLVYCAITGYGQDGPLRDRAGHDLNYLARAGLLALSGEAGGPPVQSAGQIADLGGGALMAAFGVLAALRSGRGQLVDVSMADGALSWLAMPAAAVLAEGRPARRGELTLGGSLVCYRPYRCADGWITIGALEPKFWAAFCEGVGRGDLIPHQFDPPGSEAHAEVAAIVAGRTRAEWEAFNGEHDCCVEPVHELEEALADAHFRARGMVHERALGTPVKLSETPAAPGAAAPGPGEHTDEVLAEAGFAAAEIAALREAGAIA
jgi:crotonobetainyl-CoA:carnitine CoA-transferase CaiB-like acyl-CoA transferase